MPDRPPTTDAEFKVVRGPWPRWSMHLGLIKLGLWTGAIVMICVVVALVIVAALAPHRA
jgi:hypothetical protein